MLWLFRCYDSFCSLPLINAMSPLVHRALIRLLAQKTTLFGMKTRPTCPLGFSAQFDKTKIIDADDAATDQQQIGTRVPIIASMSILVCAAIVVAGVMRKKISYRS